MRLFISYAHVDHYQVSQLVEVLRDGGYDPWFDHKLFPGQDWKAELYRAIQACEAFVYALTPESAASEWCQWEFAEAVKMQKPVIPVLLQAKTDVPEAISRFQYADFTEGPTAKSVARLMGGLRMIATIVPPQNAPTAPPNPVGIPAQAVSSTGSSGTSSSPRAVSAAAGEGTGVKAILPPPFEWCNIPAGKVTIEYGFWEKNSKGISEYKVKRKQPFDVAAFAITKYPVTNAQYQVFMDSPDGYNDPRWWGYSKNATEWRKEHAQPSPASAKDDHPLAYVSWYEAVAFCRWLTAKLNPTPNPSPKVGKGVVTLPTEQQWQRAAQGDDGRAYPWGNQFDANRCNFNSKGTTPVTQFDSGKSPFGVYDMSGNVWEWCLTRYDKDDNKLDGNYLRVLRGGSWRDTNADSLRASVRNRDVPDNWNYVRGFRLVRSL